MRARTKPGLMRDFSSKQPSPAAADSAHRGSLTAQLAHIALTAPQADWNPAAATPPAAGPSPRAKGHRTPLIRNGTEGRIFTSSARAS